jgi:hypothetical protein
VPEDDVPSEYLDEEQDWLHPSPKSR